VWVLRVLVVLAFVSTLWLAGPRAWYVLAHRFGGSEPDGEDTVRLDHVGFRQRPSWLDDQLLLAVLVELAPGLHGELAAMDETGARQFERRLMSSPWVERVGLRRVSPGRLVADIELRRPVLEVWLTPRGPPQVLVDGEGVCLPAVGETGLPRTVVLRGPGASADRLLGKRHPDPRVRAAALVAVEWRAELRSRVPAAPPLVEVDATNLGYLFLADGRWSEVRIGLARADGGIAYLAYGHPPRSRAPRVAIGTKARILRAMLAEFPGLSGIDGGDLRFVNRWRDWVRPRMAWTPGR
jgi:hypothetical protein